MIIWLSSSAFASLWRLHKCNHSLLPYRLTASTLLLFFLFLKSPNYLNYIGQHVPVLLRIHLLFFLLVFSLLLLLLFILLLLSFFSYLFSSSSFFSCFFPSSSFLSSFFACSIGAAFSSSSFFLFFYSPEVVFSSHLLHPQSLPFYKKNPAVPLPLLIG